MKVKIGRDFYDKKHDIVYTEGKVEDVTKETALWMVRNSLAYIIPNVREGRPVHINNKPIKKKKAIEESRKDKMMRKDTIKNK